MSTTATKERVAGASGEGVKAEGTSGRPQEPSAQTSKRRRGGTAPKPALSAPKAAADGDPSATKGQGSRNRELGRKGEDAAERYLAHRGYEILERNWTCFAGEADIIAKDGRCLVFVEVKTRRNTDKGFPSEAVNAKKRERYERIALAYAADFGEADLQVRFDVISIVVIGRDKAMIRHHLNAFTR